jgi:hypothetical protein
MGKNYDDYCDALNKHAEALDRSTQMAFLTYQRNESRKVPRRTEIGSMSLGGGETSRPDQGLYWHQLTPANTYREEILITTTYIVTSSVVASIAITDDDSIDPVDAITRCFNSPATRNNLFFFGSVVTATLTTPLRLLTPKAIYACLFVPVPTGEDAPVNIEGLGQGVYTVSFVESIYERSDSIPQRMPNDLPKAGDLLKPSREVQRVVGDVEKLVGAHNLD